MPEKAPAQGLTPAECVREFLRVVRSGKAPERAGLYLAPQVHAHQLESEAPRTLVRTPQQYSEHVRDMLDQWGRFELSVRELLCDGDRVHARWDQLGHLQTGPAAGAVIVQTTSSTYRVQDGRIAEYWIQIDRHGLAAQVAAAEQRGATAKRKRTPDVDQ